MKWLKRKKNENFSKNEQGWIKRKINKRKKGERIKGRSWESEKERDKKENKKNRREIRKM